MGRMQRRRAAGTLAAVVLGLGIVAGTSSGQPVDAAGTATVTATPTASLTDGASIAVKVTTTNATPAGVFMVVTQCANADSAGAPLASYNTSTYCVAAEGLADESLLLVNFPAGAVSAGEHNLTLKAAKANDIGPGHGRCVAVPPGSLPCIIRVQTATASGAYTGPGYSFQTDVTVGYASAGTTTTTAAPTTTTTTAGPTTTTTAGPTTTTTAAPTTTTTAAAPTTTTTVKAPDVTVAANPTSGLKDADPIAVEIKTTKATPAGVFIAVTQCANADSTGKVLASHATDLCVGGEGLGDESLALVKFPAGAVGAGTQKVTLKAAKKSDIGPGHGKCVAVAAGGLPCVIRVQTANVSGAYTGPGFHFVRDVALTYAGAAGGSSATTSTSTTSTTENAAAASAAVAAVGRNSSTTGGGPVLALTGSPRNPWWLVAIGFGLVELGYLAVSSTSTDRRRRRLRRS
jgi:hypothetical protein